MTNKITIVLLGMLVPATCLAQATTEKKGIRIYEHHSSEMNDGMAFGVGANGSRSGYDFVNHDYYDSFNPSTFGAWGATEIANIDLVEHEGPYGGGSLTNPFGFTSATSTIWAGDIKGNNLTVYAEAPDGFDYDMATDVSYIRDAFPEDVSKAVPEVANNKVYLGRIRETDMYIAIKVTNVENAPADMSPGSSVADVYFDFDYKYGTYDPTGIDNVVEGKQTFVIAPNPSKGNFTITDLPEKLVPHKSRLSILDIAGRVVHTQTGVAEVIKTQLQPGNYLVVLSDGNNSFRSSLVVAE